MITILEKWRKWRGLIRVEVRLHDDPSDPRDKGRLVDVWESENLIMQAGRNAVADILNGAFTGTTKIAYLGLGSDNGTLLTLADTNTVLGAEVFRKAITTYVARSSTGQNVTQTYIAPNEACSTGGTGTNFTINEIGWFNGSASASVNTGTMLARYLYNRAKSQNESLLIQRTDQF